MRRILKNESFQNLAPSEERHWLCYDWAVIFILEILGHRFGNFPLHFRAERGLPRMIGRKGTKIYNLPAVLDKDVYSAEERFFLTCVFIDLATLFHGDSPLTG